MSFGRVGSILGLLVLTVPLSCWCSALPEPPQVGLDSGPAPVYSREGLLLPRIPSGRRSEGRLAARRLMVMVRLILANSQPSHHVVISGANIINLPSPGPGQDWIWSRQVRNINNFKTTFLFPAATQGMNKANQGSNSQSSNNRNNVNTVSSSNIVSNFNTNNANVVNILPSSG